MLLVVGFLIVLVFGFRGLIGLLLIGAAVVSFPFILASMMILSAPTDRHLNTVPPPFGTYLPPHSCGYAGVGRNCLR